VIAPGFAESPLGARWAQRDSQVDEPAEG